MDTEQLIRVLCSHGYEYIETIGSGSSSNVFLCSSEKYHQSFAVKCVINNKLKASEYNALTSLHHPYIINLYEAFEYHNSEFLVMEYCPNNTLKHKRKLKYDEFIYYARQILEALAYCHEHKIAHRDIKPENIFLDYYDRIKLADFGLSKYFEQNITSNEKCGSLMYCSPEVLQKQPFDPFQADIWALGITFYYMATGSFPFPAKNYDELLQMIKLGHLNFANADLDPNIKLLIQKMTSKNPISRPTINDILNMTIFNQIKAKRITKTISSAKFGPRRKFAKNNCFVTPSFSFSDNISLKNGSDSIPITNSYNRNSSFTNFTSYKSTIRQSKSDFLPPKIPKK